MGSQSAKTQRTPSNLWKNPRFHKTLVENGWPFDALGSWSMNVTTRACYGYVECQRCISTVTVVYCRGNGKCHYLCFRSGPTIAYFQLLFCNKSNTWSGIKADAVAKILQSYNISQQHGNISINVYSVAVGGNIQFFFLCGLRTNLLVKEEYTQCFWRNATEYQKVTCKIWSPTAAHKNLSLTPWRGHLSAL